MAASIRKPARRKYSSMRCQTLVFVRASVCPPLPQRSCRRKSLAGTRLRVPAFFLEHVSWGIVPLPVLAVFVVGTVRGCPVLVFNGNHTSLHPDTISEYPLSTSLCAPLFNIFRPGCIHYNVVLPLLQQLGIGRCVQFFLAKHVYHVAFGGKAEYRVFKSLSLEIVYCFIKANKAG